MLHHRRSESLEAGHVNLRVRVLRRRPEMLDIFRKERGGGVLWMGTAKDEAEVRAIFKKLHAASPGVYFTFDRSTRTKRTIKPEEFGGDVQP